MKRKFLWLLPLFFLLAIVGVYLYPAPETPPGELYTQVDPGLTASLRAFRSEHPPQAISVNGVEWEYVALGQGQEAILFLHGMTGAQDIWWRQIEALQSSYRIISVTYPAVDSLDELAQGVLAILQKEGLNRANIVGSSLGGYLAQYLVAKYPQLVLRAVFANTFPPNDLIAAQYRTVGAILPFAPEWVVMAVLRASFKSMIYPAAGNDELTLAYLLEISYGRVGKAQVAGRYQCVIERFDPPDMSALSIPVLILEASNDPLVQQELREQLRQTYHSAQVVNMGAVGHFPYLNRPDQYTCWLREFLRTPLVKNQP
ncbi:MAG TPA: alpha/beta hydrolase [Anaerolineales bacterium]|nr:alpha/beta hydrolase [Anaerolineales bacterium]